MNELIHDQDRRDKTQHRAEGETDRFNSNHEDEWTTEYHDEKEIDEGEDDIRKQSRLAARAIALMTERDSSRDDFLSDHNRVGDWKKPDI